MKPQSPILLWFCLVLVTSLTSWINAEEKNELYARIILFADEAAEIPENYRERLGSLTLRTEKFFADGLKQWNRPIERSEIFSRDENGKVAITVVQGKLLNANGRSALPEIQRKATTEAGKQLGIKPGEKTIWWIFYLYPGVKGFQGGARGSGGMAINAYPAGQGAIDLEWELASPPMVEQSIKGTIHEFGHALGLPHIGPRPALDLGNSLMGPINKSYWGKKGTDDERVYLNEACAALIQHHPVFQKKASLEPEMPKQLDVIDLSIQKAENGNSLVIKGKFTSSRSPVSVIAVDSERHQFGDYWSRSYVGTIQPETGAFEITLSEPFESGTAFLSFCFPDGTNTGDGDKVYQRGSSISIQYPNSLN